MAGRRKEKLIYPKNNKWLEDFLEGDTNPDQEIRKGKLANYG